jgi:hypothetical protein
MTCAPAAFIRHGEVLGLPEGQHGRLGAAPTPRSSVNTRLQHRQSPRARSLRKVRPSSPHSLNRKKRRALIPKVASAAFDFWCGSWSLRWRWLSQVCCAGGSSFGPGNRAPIAVEVPLRPQVFPDFLRQESRLVGTARPLTSREATTL